MTVLALGFGLLLFASSAPAADVATDNPRRTALDKAVHDAAGAYFRDSCHVGLSMAVLRDGDTRFYNYGSTSRSNSRLPSRRSVYEIGSVTKTFTGTLAALAVVEGRMELDGDFRRHLKESYPNLESGGKPITLRTLAAHTSGLPGDIPDSSDLFEKSDADRLPFDLLERERPYDRDRYLKELHSVRLAAPPGDGFIYSNIGMKLVGFGLEEVYGRSFAELIAERIAAPLDMRRTFLEVPPQEEHLLVQGYNHNGKPMPYHLANLGAAGGLYSTSEDLIRYAVWHLGEDDPVIRQAHSLIAGTLDSYGRGMNWYVAVTPEGERKVWQSGGTFGMSSQLILFPEAREAYVLLANDACPNTQSELEKLAFTARAGVRMSTADRQGRDPGAALD